MNKGLRIKLTTLILTIFFFLNSCGPRYEYEPVDDVIITICKIDEKTYLAYGLKKYYVLSGKFKNPFGYYVAGEAFPTVLGKPSTFRISELLIKLKTEIPKTVLEAKDAQEKWIQKEIKRYEHSLSTTPKRRDAAGHPDL